MDENLAVMSEYLHSRLPLCDGGMDHVIGVVYTKEFLTAYQEAADSSVLPLISRPAVFAPVAVSLDRLLAIFHGERSHLVFLVDEHGGVEGIVTLTDVVDELLGEMSESAETQEVSAAGSGVLSQEKGVLIVAGDMPLRALAARLHLDGWCDSEPVNTIGGLLSQRLGHIPLAGEQIDVDGVHLRTIESDPRRVHRVEVAVVPKQSNDA